MRAPHQLRFSGPTNPDNGCAACTESRLAKDARTGPVAPHRKRWDRQQSPHPVEIELRTRVLKTLDRSAADFEH